MLKINNLSKSIGTFKLININFSVNKNDYLVILGKSGTGKTVLLETLCGFLKQDTGSICKDEIDISNKPIQDRPFGIVYQNQALFPHMTVYENIAYPMRAKAMPKHEIKKKIIELSELTGINELLQRKPETLSAGQAQRAALARTLSRDPEYLLLDEPLSSLDIQAKSGFRNLLRELNRKGKTIIHVTHDYEEALALGNIISVMENGTIAQTGSPEEIFTHPKSDFIAEFVGIKNYYRGKKKSENENVSEIEAGNVSFYVTGKISSPDLNIIIRSEDIILSNEMQKTSALNNFSGCIIDIERVKSGIEIIVDIGVKISALITHKSMNSMELSIGKRVWVQIKASAIKIIEN